MFVADGMGLNYQVQCQKKYQLPILVFNCQMPIAMGMVMCSVIIATKGKVDERLSGRQGCAKKTGSLAARALGARETDQAHVSLLQLRLTLMSLHVITW